MDEELEMIMDIAKENMQGAISHLDSDLAKVRAGRANPSMLDGLSVDYYGTSTPLSQVSNINTPDARTITVQAWEKNMLEPIEKAIMGANIGLNPQNNGEVIIINVPVLTEERRLQLVKNARAAGEDGKVSIRNARKDANDAVKKLGKDGLSEDRVRGIEDEIQKLTDSYSSKIDAKVEKKEGDIMTV